MASSAQASERRCGGRARGLGRQTAGLATMLQAHIRPLVSASLIVSTLLGALLLTAFFTVQIGECHCSERHSAQSTA